MDDGTLPKGVRAVVFDAVGTLIYPDPPAPEVYARIGRRYGSRLDPSVIADRFAAAFARQEAIDGAAGWRTSEEREHERWRSIVADVLDDVTDPAACFTELFTYFGRPDAWRCVTDAAATLAGLADRGYRLALASNYDRRLRAVAAGLSPLRPLQRIVISSEVGWRKPASAFFEAICREVGVAAPEILYIGDDRVNDYDGACAAGLRAILLSREEGLTPPALARLSLSDLQVDCDRKGGGEGDRLDDFRPPG
jgi:putative hydrolase of the HAD superfamily